MKNTLRIETKDNYVNHPFNKDFVNEKSYFSGTVKFSVSIKNDISDAINNLKILVMVIKRFDQEIPGFNNIDVNNNPTTLGEIVETYIRQNVANTSRYELEASISMEPKRFKKIDFNSPSELAEKIDEFIEINNIQIEF